jgi:hypothetical protein
LTNFLCWDSRCWSFLRSCFTYCRFSLAGLLSCGEQWPRVSFSVSFSSSRPQHPIGISMQVSILLPLLPSLIYRSWSLPGPLTLALVLSVHLGSLCMDSDRAFDFLRRLASPHVGLGRYLPQVHRALHRSAFSIDFHCTEHWFPCRRPVRTPVLSKSAFACLLFPPGFPPLCSIHSLQALSQLFQSPADLA